MEHVMKTALEFHFKA